MTLFIMTPVVDEVNETAYQPYRNEEISQVEALQRASLPIKKFMLENTKPDSLNLYLDFADIDYPQTVEQQVTDLPMRVVIPAFMTSELSRAFVMGFLLFIPFLLIDIVVSSTLMSMGMIMLPPATISLPFKILLFLGILISIIQAATQIHEQTITFVPKLIVIIALCIFSGSWMLETLQDYTVELFHMMLL